MKAVVFHDIGDIRVEDVKEPVIKDPTDAIVRITTSAICGTDLHMVRGTLTDMKKGTILGHEGVGMIEEVGTNVKNLRPGDRVVIPSTIACGYCSYCRAGYYSQCDNANPNGPRAGTCFYGGPKSSGPVHGLQAELARTPFANTSLIKIPEGVTDDQAILLSDIFPTGYFGADIAGIKDGDVVAVYGCGPVGQFAIISAILMNASRIFAIDCIPSRLRKAQELGAEIINYEEVHPVDFMLEMTGGIGVDKAIDAVGVDARHAHNNPAKKDYDKRKHEIDEQVRQIAPKTHPQGKLWKPGDAPNQALEWAIKSLDKAGTLSIIGVYPESDNFFPIGQAMNKNLDIRMGNCPHRRYIPKLMRIVQSGIIDPSTILSNVEALPSAIDAYKNFDQQADGWMKVALIA